MTVRVERVKSDVVAVRMKGLRGAEGFLAAISGKQEYDIVTEIHWPIAALEKIEEAGEHRIHDFEGTDRCVKCGVFRQDLLVKPPSDSDYNPQPGEPETWVPNVTVLEHRENGDIVLFLSSETQNDSHVWCWPFPKGSESRSKYNNLLLRRYLSPRSDLMVDSKGNLLRDEDWVRETPGAKIEQIPPGYVSVYPLVVRTLAAKSWIKVDPPASEALTEVGRMQNEALAAFAQTDASPFRAKLDRGAELFRARLADGLTEPPEPLQLRIAACQVELAEEKAKPTV